MKDQRIVFGLLLCLIAGSNSQDPVPCSDPDQQLMNTVVFEGESTSFSNLLDLTGVTWQIMPSYDSINDFSNTPPFTIADNNVPQSPFIGYYGVTPTQLSIPIASSYPQSSNPYSSSGVYILTYNTPPKCQTMANLIVVSYGPECLCTPATDADSAKLSCELRYGMASSAQQSATMTWYDESGNQVGGPDTPAPDPADPKYYASASALQITSSDAASYTCGVTFTAPIFLPDGFATNAPTFNASCAIANCVQKIVPTAATTTATAADSVKTIMTTLIKSTTMNPTTTKTGPTTAGTQPATAAVASTTTSKTSTFPSTTNTKIATTTGVCVDKPTCAFNRVPGLNLNVLCPAIRNECPALCKAC